jgi:hypothetical protein
LQAKKADDDGGNQNQHPVLFVEAIDPLQRVRVNVVHCSTKLALLARNGDRGPARLGP